MFEKDTINKFPVEGDNEISTQALISICEMDSIRLTIAELLQLEWNELEHLRRIFRTECHARKILGDMVHSGVRYLSALNNDHCINLYDLFHKNTDIKDELIKYFSYQGPLPYRVFISSIRREIQSEQFQKKAARQFIQIAEQRYIKRILD